VGILGTIVQVPAGPVPHTGQDLSLCDAVAAEPIGHNAARLVLQAGQQALEEAPGGCGIAALLHKDVEHNTMLVHRAPEIEELAVDLQVHFIEVPGVTRPRPPLAQLGCEIRAEAQAPTTDTLVADHYAPLGEDQLNVPKVKAEHMDAPI
jgi:hypothetical protein